MVSTASIPQFISPAQAANYHYWVQNDSVYEEVVGGDSNSGIGHCCTFSAKGSYEIPNRTNEYRHEFTFGAQATTENDGGRRPIR